MYIPLLLSSLLAQPMPASSEVADMHRWAQTRFGQDDAAPRPGLRLVSGHDALQVNHHRGQELSAAGRTYTRGLYVHAPGEVAVTLPGPGDTFSVLLGVDTNFQTSGGRGSVDLAVDVRGSTVFQSQVVREGGGPIPCTVDLAGATVFTLRVGDGGDGIACDQAALLDPRVTLADGSEVLLDELPRAGWLDDFYDAAPPFSFTYAGVSSRDFLASWLAERQERMLDADRLERTITWTDPDTELSVQCVSVTYLQFPLVEWTVWLENGGDQDTPLLEGLHALDITPTQLTPEAPPLLHHNKGTVVTTVAVPEGKHDFEPLETRLKLGEPLRFTPPQGRPCAGEWPYFNLAYPDGGLLFAVGWPGQWTASFEALDTRTTHIRAGQATTHFRLRPGERVRTPLIALQFSQGNDWMRAQNVWRRWMRAWNTPSFHGKPLEPFTAGFCGYYAPPGLELSARLEMQFIDLYAQKGFPLDGWWIDAGWYQCVGDFQNTGTASHEWNNTGTWKVDRTRFPEGLRPCFDLAKEKGFREAVLWMEPERVVKDMELHRDHPEWLLDASGGWATMYLLNFGDPEAAAWITRRVGDILEEAGATVYREDHNFAPLDYWLQNDGPDRKGITENLYIQGHLKFWDDLRDRIPGLLIDTCASGGHRLDLETLRRSVPLWRTDWPWEPLAQQCQTYGISQWIPYHGTGVVDGDDYTVRSDMAPFFLLSWDLRREDLDYARLRQLEAEWRATAKYRLGDFWPITDYSLSEGAWCAWQYDRPDMDEGLIQVFRRSDSIYRAADLRLHGLMDDAWYQVEDMDAGALGRFKGSALMAEGLPLTVGSPRTAVTLVYRRE